ncbi:uncharacterized protein C2845_PM13G24130 [Panicum miliaceum]|uniref:Uncharacterized protein n=1 Tax=Panicum miliaceum TaxID=4540 RepID=A0A3L6RIC0_PANMI|nr:uncharacterized protein C2845_PM13G24130 [Panicum miliaceum]
MKSIGKAAELLRKAVGALQGKAAVVRARLLFLASLRRRMAVVAGISRHIRALTQRQGQGREKKAAQCQGTAVAPAEVDADDERVGGLPVPELARLFEQVADEDGDGGYAEWALTLRSLFDDDEDSSERRAGASPAVDGLDDDDDVGQVQEEEPSVIDVIRSRLEGDGREFRIEDEIDRAADMYIARVRRRIMNAHTAGAC